MNSCETIKELRREFKGVKTGVAGDTIFGAKALMFIAERLVENRTETRAKIKPSAWQKFVGKGLRAGKSMKQIAQEWRARRPGNGKD
jgi:DNA-binding NarL/FixJ family response regulator